MSQLAHTDGVDLTDDQQGKIIELLHLYLPTIKAIMALVFKHAANGLVGPGKWDDISEVFYRSVHDATDEELASVKDQGAPVDCQAGCWWCCTMFTDCAPGEAVLIARHIKKWPDLAEVKKKLIKSAALARRTKGNLADYRREMVPCAFLDTDRGLCRVYEVRPLACRKYTSTDVKACQNPEPQTVGMNGPVHMVGVAMGAAAMKVWAEAFVERGLDGFRDLERPWQARMMATQILKLLRKL